VRLYTWRRAGLADEVGCDAIPDTAGGEGVTGSLNRKGKSTGTYRSLSTAISKAAKNGVFRKLTLAIGAGNGVYVV
jgi:hypothetical protein